jgi:hypothetical protein
MDYAVHEHSLPMFTGKNMQDEALDSGIVEDDNNQSIVRHSRG